MIAIFLALFMLVLQLSLIGGLISGLAVGIGFLLQACFPALQLGHGIIAGAVIGSTSLHFLTKFIKFTNHDEDEFPNDHPVLVLPKNFRKHLDSTPKSQKKKK